MTPILEVNNIKKQYVIKSFLEKPKIIQALNGVSFKLHRKETLAVVGESGCGKSTLAKVLMQIENFNEGQITLDQQSILSIPKKDFYKKIQMIFQDPYSSINPRFKAWQIISEPLVINQKISNEQAKAKAIEMMDKVGLRPEMADRYPHMFSGGQRQRLGIARALMLKPQILICDEPVSALDVSIQAQVLNLLIDLQDQLDLSYVFISHDLNVVRHIADKILVMYQGQIVESGTRDEIFKNPQHEYTRVLLASRTSF